MKNRYTDVIENLLPFSRIRVPARRVARGSEKDGLPSEQTINHLDERMAYQ
jgi:hypothetical protein